MKSYEDWYFLNDDSRVVLSRGQDFGGLTPEERYYEIADHAEKVLRSMAKYENYRLDGFADRMKKYFRKGWASLATPVWNNFGRESGLPISCFGSYIGDNISHMYKKNAEIAVMTQKGGGTSFYLGAIRPRGSAISTGGVSEGPTRFAEIFDKTVEIVNQGGVRRGACAAYLNADYDNPRDVLDFLSFREEHSPVKTLNIGITFTDEWISQLKEDIKNKVQSDKQKIWRKVLKRRDAKGIPYIMFKDNANRNKPQIYKDKEMEIVASNLCNEIYLPSNEDLSFVCCLSSLNLVHFDAWKNTLFVQDMHWFLDSVMQEFIEKSKDVPELAAAYNFAVEHRALGLGWLGYHSALKDRGLGVSDIGAYKFNEEVAEYMVEECHKANVLAAEVFGEPELLTGYGLRNTTSIAIAPTLSSSFVLGQVSAGIELDESVYYSKNGAKGDFAWRCPAFTEVLEKYGMNTEEVWDSVAINHGSVEHLEFLSAHEKNVFKSSPEVNQVDILAQAGQRQKVFSRYGGQGQSLNIRTNSDMTLKQKSDLLFKAHELGLNGVYYQISDSAVKKATLKNEECVACSA